jgi:hypothetical protein
MRQEGERKRERGKEQDGDRDKMPREGEERKERKR